MYTCGHFLDELLFRFPTYSTIFPSRHFFSDELFFLSFWKIPGYSASSRYLNLLLLSFGLVCSSIHLLFISVCFINSCSNFSYCVPSFICWLIIMLILFHCYSWCALKYSISSAWLICFGELYFYLSVLTLTSWSLSYVVCRFLYAFIDCDTISSYFFMLNWNYSDASSDF